MAVILFEPEVAGNVGAIARVMANFGFKDLVLVNRKCDHLSKEAQDRAKHAKTILVKAKVVTPDQLKKYRVLVGTTCRLGTDYNVTRTPLVPSQIPEVLRASARDRNTGILFGSEGTGLSNDILELCDYLITIPTSPDYPALNLSHAVSIVLYELTKMAGEDRIKERFPLVNPRTKAVLDETIFSLIDGVYGKRPNVIPTVRQVWKRVLGTAHITAREAATLVGFFKGLRSKK